MTVEELTQRISHLEFVRWNIYFGRRAQREEMARKMRGLG